VPEQLARVEQQNVSITMKREDVAEQSTTVKKKKNVHENFATMEKHDGQEHLEIMELENILMEEQNQEHLDSMEQQKNFMELHNFIIECQNALEY